MAESEGMKIVNQATFQVAILALMAFRDADTGP